MLFLLQVYCARHERRTGFNVCGNEIKVVDRFGTRIIASNPINVTPQDNCCWANVGEARSLRIIPRLQLDNINAWFKGILLNDFVWQKSVHLRLRLVHAAVWLQYVCSHSLSLVDALYWHKHQVVACWCLTQQNLRRRASADCVSHAILWLYLCRRLRNSTAGGNQWQHWFGAVDKISRCERSVNLPSLVICVS